MTTGVERKGSPEELELELKQREFDELEVRLVRREVELATLNAQIHAFQSTYVPLVGVRSAELNQLEAQISEALARVNPKDEMPRQQATRARSQSQEYAHVSEGGQAPTSPKKFTPSDRLKQLYREVAKRIHPDFATDDAERARRTKLMAEANRAYEAGDEAFFLLQTVMGEWERSPESVEGEGPAAELVRLIRKIAQAQARIGTVEVEIAQFKDSDIYEIMTRVKAAGREDRDLLAEIAARLDENIADARGRLDKLIKGGARPPS